MSWMILPVLACVVIVITLGWFGLHVLERGVIFVDLALAQVAALGTTWAVYLGHEPDGATAFAMALLFTFIGAAAFSAARLFEERVPQEAIIGIAYAVSAAAGILMIHFAEDGHGGEKLEHLLVGNIVWVQPNDVALLAGVCAVVGLFHVLARERFLQISYRPDQARAEKRNVALWDLLFYASFGLALTAIVSVSGVILVFSYLVIPAVIARLLVTGVVPRLLVGWATGLVVSVAGVAVSYEHPTGPTIVTFFGALLTVVLVGFAIRHAADQVKAAGQAVGIGAALVAVLWGFAQIPADHEQHEHAEASAAGDPVVAASVGLAATDPGVRETAVRAAVGDAAQADALAGALAGETDESLKLAEAVALAKGNDRRGVEGLVALTRSETPFVRMEADSRLRILAGARAPAYDPLGGPDATGVWAAWLQTVDGVPMGAAGLEMP